MLDAITPSLVQMSEQFDEVADRAQLEVVQFLCDCLANYNFLPGDEHRRLSYALFEMLDQAKDGEIELTVEEINYLVQVFQNATDLAPSLELGELASLFQYANMKLKSSSCIDPFFVVIAGLSNQRT